MTKSHLKLVSKLYAASMLIQQDGSYDPDDVGLTEKESALLTTYVNDIGIKMLKGHKKHPSLEQIVEYVYNLYYE